jgi:hypothetical protein
MAKTRKTTVVPFEPPNAKGEPELTAYQSDAVGTALLRVRVVGEGPLLTHNPAAMSNKTGDAKRGSRIPSAELEAENGAYRLEDGTLGIKGESFVGAIAGKSGAAGAFKTKNRGTMKSRLTHISCVEELVPLVHAKTGEPIRDYIIDQRPVVVQKSRIIRARPLINDWSATFTIQYDPQLVAEPLIILEILSDAGRRIGVGDYRPRFGRFSVAGYALL